MEQHSVVGESRMKFIVKCLIVAAAIHGTITYFGLEDDANVVKNDLTELSEDAWKGAKKTYDRAELSRTIIDETR
jgi:hypothetical protein